MYRTDFWTVWEKARVGCFKRTASKHVYYLGWNRSPAQVACMRQVLGPGRPRGIRWRGRWEGGSGWGIHVNSWLIHVNVWQKPLQYCKVISLQLIKINEKKKIITLLKSRHLVFVLSCYDGFDLVVSECPGTHLHNHTRFPSFTKDKWVGLIHHVQSAQMMLHSGAGIWANGSRWGVCHLGQDNSPEGRWPQVCCPSPSPELSCALHLTDEKAQFSSAVTWSISQDWGPGNQMREKTGPFIHVEDSPLPLEGTG